MCIFPTFRPQRNGLGHPELIIPEKGMGRKIFLSKVAAYYKPQNPPVEGDVQITLVFDALLSILSYRSMFWLEFHLWRDEEKLIFCITVSEYVFLSYTHYTIQLLLSNTKISHRYTFIVQTCGPLRDVSCMEWVHRAPNPIRRRLLNLSPFSWIWTYKIVHIPQFIWNYSNNQIQRLQH